MKKNITKKQHYVPKFYLKNFARSNNCFTILNIDKKQIINDAPYKDQCHEKYFYDDDNIYETKLSNLEYKWSDLFNKIIKQDYYPNEDDKKLIKQFAVFQRNRTLLHSEEVKEMMWQTIKTSVEMDSKIKNLKFSEQDYNNAKITFLKDKAKDVTKNALEQSYEYLNYINDLDVCIIKYNTKLKLISSDNPIIHYNNFYFRSIGYANAGLIIFFPINNNILIVIYDSKMYKFNDNLDFIINNNEYEVKHLNIYQILNSNKIVYFDDKRYIKNIEKIIKNEKIKNYINLGKKNTNIIGPNLNKLISFHPKIIYLKHNFSFAKLPKSYYSIDECAIDWFPRKYDKNYHSTRMKFRENTLIQVLKEDNIKTELSSKKIKVFNDFVINYWNDNL